MGSPSGKWQHSTADAVDLAGDVAGLFGEQERGERGNVVRMARPDRPASAAWYPSKNSAG